jgi:hypothetical protein
MVCIFLTQIMLINGFVLFPHEEYIEIIWKTCKNRVENITPYGLYGSKIYVASSKYFFCTSLNT